MAMFAFYNTDYIGWDYLHGCAKLNLGITESRYYYLKELNELSKDSMKISIRDVETNAWTKWDKFPGKLIFTERVNQWEVKTCLSTAYDVHRSTLDNEIVVESDYMCDECKALKKAKKPSVKGCLECYELNYEASRFIGRLLEHKGFSPLYYYSGNKSIHIHVFLDFSEFTMLDIFLQKEIKDRFKYRSGFVKKFMGWLRAKIIDFWGMKNREFDKDLINCKHLIRSEMSLNKTGFKTFLGYSYKDLSFIPYICNFDNRVYPKLGVLKLSRPYDFQEIVEDFLNDINYSKKVQRVNSMSVSLNRWIDKDEIELRSCIKLILDNSFRDVGDGYKRAVFILANELKRVYPDKAVNMLNDWNERMGYPIKQEELDHKLNNKEYSLSCKYVHDFLSSLGIKNIPVNCKHNIYKH